MLYKILHVFVLINLLTSSAGLTIHEHTCKIKGKSYSLFSKDKTCCAAGNNKTCSADAHPDNPDDLTFKRKRCCENKVFHDKLLIESASIDKLNTADLKPDFQKITVKCGFRIYATEIINQNTLHTSLYHPPPDSRGSLRILFQSFLC
jgi:hypothetical protein